MKLGNRKALVMGSGGREHALAWRLAQDLGKENVFLHPGNGGTAYAGFPVFPSVKNPAETAVAAKQLGIDLVVIGPELLLAEGYSDHLRHAGLLVCGASKMAAQLETSKVFAKEFMSRHAIPTAAFQVARSPEELATILGKIKYPTVLKLDGLAAGKGVVIPATRAEALEFSDRVWKQNEFGSGPHAIVVEDCLPGTEISWIGLCDGKRFTPLPSATDYKRVGDGHTGPNTGGMGVVSPSPYETPELKEKIAREVVAPVISGLIRDKLDYRGALYIGIMISPEGNPYVLEFNTRFGDPETQATLPRLRGNFFELLRQLASGEAPETIDIDARATVYVVAAAEGYPGSYRKGMEISDDGHDGAEAWLFFSGVSFSEKRLKANGGRVLGACGIASQMKLARNLAYRRLEKVTFDGRFFRKDIGNF